MTEFSVETPRHDSARAASKALRNAAVIWFTVTAIGQWLFVAYILGYFGRLIINKGLEGLNSTHLPLGYVPGDPVGNAEITAHVLLAAVIIGGGTLQLIPAIRFRFPTFHRWNGRIYMGLAVIVSIAGLYMMWIRGGGSLIGDFITHLGTSISGVLILIFAFMALRAAQKRDFVVHRRWALRLFMVVSTVWFIRLMTFGWIMATGGIGIEFKTFTGPFVSVASYVQWCYRFYYLSSISGDRNMQVH
jgi:hypothetical protein